MPGKGDQKEIIGITGGNPGVVQPVLRGCPPMPSWTLQRTYLEEKEEAAKAKVCQLEGELKLERKIRRQNSEYNPSPFKKLYFIEYAITVPPFDPFAPLLPLL